MTLIRIRPQLHRHTPTKRKKINCKFIIIALLVLFFLIWLSVICIVDYFCFIYYLILLFVRYDLPVTCLSICVQEIVGIQNAFCTIDAKTSRRQSPI